MWLIDKLKKLFVINVPKKVMKPKILGELDYLDDVWIKDNAGNLFKGWVFDINKKHIIATVPSEDGSFLDFRFSITRPLTQTELNQNNKTLYLNKP